MKKLISLLLCGLLLLTGCHSDPRQETQPQTGHAGHTEQTLYTEQTEPTQPTEQTIHTEPTEQTEPAETTVSADLLLQSILLTLSEADESGESVPGYLTEMDARRVIEVLSCEQLSEDRIAATVSVAAPDLYSVIKALENESFTCEAEMDAALTEGVKTARPVKKELTLNFYLEGDWVPSLTEEFMDACYGGILTLRQEYFDAMEGVE